MPNDLDEHRSELRTKDKVRHLTAADLGLQLSMSIRDANSDADHSVMDESDEVLARVRDLLRLGFGGIALVGPPGTGKTWYARRIAETLTHNASGNSRFLQFHPSYQYEDFVEGYVPTETGFELRAKHLLEMCERARQVPHGSCVLVIDELSRVDPTRVFGEALTYVESGYRDREFSFASGTRASIPSNLIFLATMNPFDRGVDELDFAFERRFARVYVGPDASVLDTFLTQNGIADDLRGRVGEFFQYIQRHPNPLCRIGHAYFRSVRDEHDLKLVWDHQLRYHFEKVFRFDANAYEGVATQWARVFRD